MFNSLYSSTNQDLFEKHFCNQGSHYENMDNFCHVKEAISVQPMLFTVNKDEWNTKEGTGKSMMNASAVLWNAKRHLSG